ncbi:prepilin peptidase [Vibrio albus]|uniref:Prepilin peptidase n=1 Tax=Vibrio albus TaxID=2200953 RepID=A0A2U3BE46_9VIBR|nr:SEC-C metal-binding domain-containing protein [Vibrio albus]PWI35022.1 prepilin peptidase [Vibrio albus]
MKLIALPEEWQGETTYFIEGAVLAANMAVKPLEPESWCQSLGLSEKPVYASLVEHIHHQHNLLSRNEYTLNTVSGDELADLAEGFMTVWPQVEEQWQDVNVSDGTVRMLQALLTTLMLLVDEALTRQQMIDAGIDTPPTADEMRPQLDMMVNEVAQAADEAMLGMKAQTVNPYKGVGRNDPCPCLSGKKFKQCCGK